MSASPAVLVARLIESKQRIESSLGQRKPASPRYHCLACDQVTSTPSTTDASDYYPTADGNLAYQYRHYLCCPTCFSTNVRQVP